MKLPQSPPPLTRLLGQINVEDIDRVLNLPSLVKDQYIHWDKLRHRQPPEGLSHESWWLGIKQARNSLLKQLPLQDKQGQPFQFGIPEPVLQHLHRIDRNAAGGIDMDSPIATEEDRDRYLVSSLIEEAITSSQLEGAATTRDEAKNATLGP